MLFKCTLSNGLERVACKSNRRRYQCQIMAFEIAEMNFGLGDMNRYTPDAVYVHL